MPAKKEREMCNILIFKDLQPYPFATGRGLDDFLTPINFDAVFLGMLQMQGNEALDVMKGPIST